MSAADDSDLKMDDADEKLADEVDFIALNETINGNSSSYIELERDYHGSFNERNGIQINRPNVVIDGNGHNIDSTGQTIQSAQTRPKYFQHMGEMSPHR